MLRRLPRFALSVLALAAGCNDDPVAPPDTDTPAVTAASIEVDIDEKVAAFSLTADDPDGPVAISCTGAFPVTGTDAVSAERPLSEVRLIADLATTCALEENDATIEHTVTYTGSFDVDLAPRLTSPRPIETMRVGVPVPLRFDGSDDWELASYSLAWAPGQTAGACDAPTGELPAVPTGSVTTFVDTATVTFTTPGLHCIRFIAEDDAGQLGTVDSVYMVGTADPPILDPAMLLAEFSGRQQYEESAVRLSLAFADTDPISGVWVMHYSTTTASDEGTFTGTYAGGTLTLNLAVAHGCSGDYTLTGRALDPAGEYWTFEIHPSGGCWAYASAPITIFRQEVPDLPGLPDVQVIGQVTDPEGVPISILGVSVASGPFARAPEVEVSGGTNDEGRYSFSLGESGSLELDSVLVTGVVDACTGLAETAAVRRGIALEDVPVNVVTVDLQLTRAHPVATLAVGPACAEGWWPFFGPSAPSTVQLWFDVVSEGRIAGRWRMNYRQTRIDDLGYFSGT